MRATSRTALVGMVAASLLVAAGVVAQQVDAQRYSTAIAQHHPWAWLLGFGTSALLAAAAVGTSLATRGGVAQLGLLVGWVAPLLVAWESGPPAVRAAALAVGPWTPLLSFVAVQPLVDRRPPPRLVAVAIVCSVMASALLLFGFEPYRLSDCFADCARNPWAVAHLHSVVQLSTTLAVLAGAILAAQLLRDATRAGSDAPALAGVCGAAAAGVLLPLASWVFVKAPAVWVGAAVGLLALSGALLRVAASTLARRRRVKALVTVLSAAPEPEELTAALTRALGGPVEVTYPDPAGRGSLDSAGHPTSWPGGDRLDVTSRGALVAVIAGAGVRTAASEVVTLDPALALLVENASVVAGLRAQVARVRTARAAVVRANDEERARLERDLHDGAQQLVLALAVDLRLLADACAPGSGGRQTALQARDEVVEALSELRVLAHGLHPAALTQGGLCAAVDVLAEQTGVQVILEGSVDLPPETLMAAYRLVEVAAEQAARRGRASVSVVLEAHPGRVSLQLDDGCTEPLDPGLEEDRVLALGGELRPGPPLQAELPFSRPLS